MLSVFLALALSACDSPTPPVPPASQVQADCGSPHNLDHHEQAGRTDICGFDWPDHFQVLINWGTKPEWIDDSHFVFLGNQIGHVYMMDIASREITNLTGHFSHAGYTRAHKLKNGDLLLLGPSEGPQPPEDPLSHYSVGQFTGDLWVLKKPYDGPPVPLGVHAWEGIAVSRESNRIAWADTDVPFFGDNLIETALLYVTGRSKVWTALLEYDEQGVPNLLQKEELLDKWQAGPVSLETQNFLGKRDEELLVSAYGPFENISGLLVIDRKTKGFRRIPEDPNVYHEWEGVHPDYRSSFVEIDNHLFLSFGFDFVELYLYHFQETDAQKKLEQVTFFERDYDKHVYVHEPVFSENGKRVLMTTASASESAPASPGYGIGIVLFDYEAWRRENPR